tara:strand:- start:245 stop:1207 length:963 start_codon:yes stop_codon:yes gene_type:complete
VKKLNKTVLLAAVLASAANAGVTISGDATMGVQYLSDATTVGQEHRFSVRDGNSNNGKAHLNFSMSEAGKSGTGAYAFIETIPSFSSTATLSTGQTYVGYKGQRFDIRLGTIDSLTYEWVGSLNEADFKYANNIAVKPMHNEDQANTARVTTKLGPVLIGIAAANPVGTQNYLYQEIGAKFELNKVNLALVHQKVDDDDATAFNNRNTDSFGLTYSFKHLTSTKFLKDLDLNVTYASYSEDHASNGESDAMGIGFKINNTALMYQTSDRKDQARYNLVHTRPISKNTSLGIELQTGDDYMVGATKTQDDTFGVVYLTYSF